MTGVTGIIPPGLTVIIGFVVMDLLTFWDAQDATQKNNATSKFPLIGRLPFFASLYGRCSACGRRLSRTIIPGMVIEITPNHPICRV